jgi:hypothetical protein
MRPFFSLFLSTLYLLAAPLAGAQTTKSAEAAPAVAAPSAPVETVRIGTFKQVEGETWAGRAGARRAAEPGAGVALAERLSTGKNGAATITLKDGTVLTMGPNTTMDLSRFQFDSTTQKGHFGLDLLQGTVRVVTGLLARINPELFKVSTPTSVVGVRGTDFIVETAAAE